MENYGLNLYGLEQGQAAGSCKHGYEIYNVYKQTTNALQFYNVLLFIIFTNMFRPVIQPSSG
jgi:hypothetical protein